MTLQYPVALPVNTTFTECNDLLFLYAKQRRLNTFFCLNKAIFVSSGQAVDFNDERLINRTVNLKYLS